MPLWPVPHGLRAQIVIISLAALAVIALAAILIRDVISQTESRLLAEARRQCEAASRELVRQYQERTAWGGDRLENLPIEAQDLSLRGLTATVLRSYEGLEGGFHHLPGAEILGQADGSGRVRTLSPRELELVAAAGAQAGWEPGVATGLWERDLVVVAAAKLEGGGAAFALKRLSGVRDPVGRRRRWVYGALALAATLGVGAIVSLWIALRTGVARISTGLGIMEHDLAYRLPAIAGEFGRISRAINQMADRRMILEAEVRRQDRLAALGKVVAGVAHEIRNPLNSMRLTLELLERRLKKGVAGGDEVRAAMREIDRLDRILARLLAFGRPAPADRRPQDLRPLLEEAIRMVQEQARSKSVEILTQADQPELVVDVDGPQIVQVLVNLLLNAIEASPPSGRIEVAAGAVNGRVEVRVTDHGPGIPDEVRPHIFDAFFTTRPEGAGLGLSVSREIVAAHGGELDYEPAGPGTTFRMSLPAGRGTA